MKIKGNTVGTTMPRTNYEQTDPKKADYLRGKNVLDQKIEEAKQAGTNAQAAAGNAQTAADDAQAAANKAQTTADNALAAAGNAQTAAGNAQTAAVNESKEYTDSKHSTFAVTLTVNDWDGDAAPYTQTIGVEGILGTDRPHYGPVYDADKDTRLAQKEAFAMVDDLDTSNGSVTFTCFEDKPAVNIPIQMEVNR